MPGISRFFDQRNFRTLPAIDRDKWPYDNGDDPSFYAASKGGPLTWAICRTRLRNSIAKDSIVVFFSFTQLKDRTFSYRLCAVETVADKLDHREIHHDKRFSNIRHLYINGLIRPENDGWRYSEADRPADVRHDNWLWRMADHRGTKYEDFKEKYASIIKEGWFSETALASGELKLGRNYVILSDPPDRAFISPNPPVVATAVDLKTETWSDRKLEKLTVGTAVARHKRANLRIANPSRCNVHPQIRFDLPSGEASTWRDELIQALNNATRLA